MSSQSAMIARGEPSPASSASTTATGVPATHLYESALGSSATPEGQSDDVAATWQLMSASRASSALSDLAYLDQPLLPRATDAEIERAQRMLQAFRDASAGKPSLEDELMKWRKEEEENFRRKWG